MNLSKIAEFYDDPIKTACDAWSMTEAHRVEPGGQSSARLMEPAVLLRDLRS